MRMYKYKPFLSQESICNENDFQKKYPVTLLIDVCHFLFRKFGQ